ncbi:MAG: hypothetical protein ACLFUS_11630 [Candidatus Sumerlaeia bacterium]
MAHDNFKIRIRRDGTVEFISRELGEAQFRQIREMLEDALGPVQDIREVEGDDAPPPGVGIVDEEVQEEIRKQK